MTSPLSPPNIVGEDQIESTEEPLLPEPEPGNRPEREPGDTPEPPEVERPPHHEARAAPELDPCGCGPGAGQEVAAV